MKFKLSIFIIAIGFCFISCKDKKNEPEPVNEATFLKWVTGIRMTDFQGAPIGMVGNPNTKPGIFSIYPNPASDVFTIGAPNGIESFVVIKGEKKTEYADENFDQLLKDQVYSESEILETDRIKMTFDSLVQNVSVNTQDLNSGYYRVFYRVKRSDDYIWDNIYINHEIPYPAMIDSLVNDWK